MIFRRLLILIIVFSLGCSFQTDETPGPRQETYFLHRAGYEPVRGKAVFTELGPGRLSVEITLINTDERVDFPAHLHFGTIREAGELAFRLENVDGSSGRSYTELDQVALSNGEIFNFDLLKQMNGSVKIHMAETGVLKNIPIAYGNIGVNENYFTDGITVCTGH